MKKIKLSINTKRYILILFLFLYSTVELHSQDVRDTSKIIYIHDIVQDTSTINKKDEYGRKQGIWYLYGGNGSEREKWEYLDDMKHGCYEFHVLSRLMTQCYYKYGKLDSIYREYWNWGNEKGNLYIEAYFKDGFPHGVTKTYAENGELMTRINYQYGKIDSTDSLFYISENYIRPTVYSRTAAFIRNICPRLDTIEAYSSDKFKEDSIFYNNTFYKNRFFYKNQLYVEDFYIQGIITKSIEYYTKKPYGVKKIAHFSKDGTLVCNIEYYNRKGIFVKSRCYVCTANNEIKTQ